MGDRAQAVGLFRYSLVREASDGSLSARERGRLVRALAVREHVGPDGRPVRVSRNTLDRWIRAYRTGGFAALVPSPRRVQAQTPAGLLELACSLRAEQPARTAAQIARIVVEAEGWAPTPRTLQRHLARAGLAWKGAGPVRAYGRFEAERPNELWTGDALHGPRVGGRKAILFCFLDDHSRLFCGYRWGLAEDVLRAEAALRSGLGARGVPSALYVDNGSPFISSQLLRACATLGIRLIHSRPGRPQGRGKIERAFRTVREQFLVELAGGEVDDLSRLNALFQAWVESVYHRRVHSQTGQAPLERFLAAGVPALPTEAELHDAFLWSEARTVSKVATVSLHGNEYEVEAELAGSCVELIFDPFDLQEVEVRFQGRPVGKAVPRRIERHVHPRARPEPGPERPRPTGIDYLALIQARRAAELQRRIDYRELPKPGDSDDETDIHDEKEND